MLNARHKHYEPARQRHVRRNAGAFLSERLLCNLNNDFLAGLQKLRDGRERPFGARLVFVTLRFHFLRAGLRGRRHGCSGTAISQIRSTLSELAATTAIAARNTMRITPALLANTGGLPFRFAAPLLFGRILGAHQPLVRSSLVAFDADAFFGGLQCLFYGLGARVEN